MKKVLTLIITIGFMSLFACSEETPEEEKLNTPADDNGEQVVEDPMSEPLINTNPEEVIVEDEEEDDEEILEVE